VIRHKEREREKDRRRREGQGWGGGGGRGGGGGERVVGENLQQSLFLYPTCIEASKFATVQPLTIVKIL